MELRNIAEELNQNPYPGRGIILGRSEDGNYAVMAYFIMGRSENSRNRVFTKTEDGIKTEAFDSSKLTDPSLIIYHPLRVYGTTTIITNGDQTDTVRDALAAGKSYMDALRTREFEPDAPNYTPRISGVLAADGSYALSILKSFEGNPSCCKRFFYEYDRPVNGLGHFIHTYRCDGDPLPSFEGEPKTIRVEGDAAEFAQTLWDNLNADNKVSLMVRFIHLATGKVTDVIRNKHQ